MRCHLAKTVSRIACAVLAHRSTQRPLSHWQEIGSRFELDRGYPGIPLCVYLCYQLAEEFEKNTVFSIYIGTFTTDIKQMYCFYIYQRHYKSTTLFCRRYFPHLGPTRTPVPQCQNTCQTPSFLKDATAAIVS